MPVLAECQHRGQPALFIGDIVPVPCQKLAGRVSCVLCVSTLQNVAACYVADERQQLLAVQKSDDAVQELPALNCPYARRTLLANSVNQGRIDAFIMLGGLRHQYIRITA